MPRSRYGREMHSSYSTSGMLHRRCLVNRDFPELCGTGSFCLRVSSGFACSRFAPSALLVCEFSSETAELTLGVSSQRPVNCPSNSKVERWESQEEMCRSFTCNSRKNSRRVIGLARAYSHFPATLRIPLDFRGSSILGAGRPGLDGMAGNSGAEGTTGRDG